MDPVPHRGRPGPRCRRPGPGDHPGLRGHDRRPSGPWRLHDRPDRHLQGQRPRPRAPGSGHHRHAHREAVDRQREARLGRSLSRGGLGLQHRDREGGCPQGLRRGAVRLRALPHRRPARRCQILQAEHEGDPAADHRGLPRAGQTGAGPVGRLRGRRRVRLHGVQRERHRHRPADRGAGAAPRLHLPDGLPVRLPRGNPRLSQSGGESLRGRPRERPADSEASGGHAGARATVAAGLQGLRVRPARVRRHRGPRADAGGRRRRRRGLDAVEPPQRLYGRGLAPEESPRRAMKARGAFAVAVAVLLVAAFVLPAPGQSLAPNELGRVMILEYHKIDYPEERWTRTPENFRRDLETLYARGYRLIALNDLLDGTVRVPAGTTPIVLTFDDSSPGQFRYVEQRGALEIDPKSGVGILETFISEHPDFGRGATFYVLPGASRPNRLFDQPEHEGRKLRFLVERGYEIGNHTLWHANLGKYDETTVRAQLADAQVWVQRHVPQYKLRTLALPHGVYPRNVAWARSGSAKGTSYQHDAILMVAGGAAPSPFSASFDAAHLPRIQAVECDLGYWLSYFEKNPNERFVSDGDPARVTVPVRLREKLRSPLPRSLRVVTH